MGTVQSIADDRSVILDERNQNAECIACLEDMLEKAKAGEVVGVAIACQYADRAVGEAIGGFAQNRPMVGALMGLVMRLMA